MKPPMAVLRKRGIKVFNYIDDLFAIANTKEQCERNIQEVIQLLTGLGFFINYGKSPLDTVEKTIQLLHKFSNREILGSEK